MKRFLFLLLVVLALVCCKREIPVSAHGSFSIDGTEYPISALRVDHVGYASADSSLFVLRVTASPATLEFDTALHRGYGTAVILYFTAQDNDIKAGEELVFCPDSLSVLLTVGDAGDTVALRPISSGRMTVGEGPNDFLDFAISFTTADGAYAEGSFLGNYTVNYTVDQPYYGHLSFDTIDCRLARPVLRNWGHLFNAECNYYELMFFSADARFNDQGKIRAGVQFAVGINSEDDLRPTGGDYPVLTDYSPHSLLYGVKTGNSAWGTYWQVFLSGSVRGKANILDGNLAVTRLLDDYLSCTFQLTDQLGNTVVGSYDGPMIR